MALLVGIQRSYQQACGIAYALDVVGERWALLLVRELILGPKRFGELQDSLLGMGSNLLSTRLRNLERLGIVEKKDPPDGGKRHLYALSPLGRELEAVLGSLIRWGVKLPDEVKGADDRYLEEWDLVALRLLYRAEFEPLLRGVVLLKTAERELLVHVGDSGLSFEPAPGLVPNCELSGDRDVLVGLFEGKTSLPQLLGAGTITVSGDAEFASRWSACFRDDKG